MVAALIGTTALTLWALMCASPARARRWFARWHLREIIFYTLPCLGVVALTTLPMDALDLPPGSAIESIVVTPLFVLQALVVFPAAGISLARWVGPGWARDTLRSWWTPPGKSADVPTREHRVPWEGITLTFSAPHMWGHTRHPDALYRLIGPSPHDSHGVVLTVTTPTDHPPTATTRLLHDGHAEVGTTTARHQIHLVTDRHHHLTRRTWTLTTHGGLTVQVEHADLDSVALAPHIDRLLATLRIDPEEA